MGNAGRRLASLTLDNLQDVTSPCRSCVFWELDHVAGERAREAGDPELEKEAWISATLLEWGSCGTVAYVDDAPVGYVLFAPPSFVPRSVMFPTSPIAADALQLVTARVIPPMWGSGLGRALVQAAAHHMMKRGVQAIEAYGDAKKEEPSCLLPSAFLLSVGFKTVRPHPNWPRLRLDLSNSLTLGAEVEVAIERLIGVVRPVPSLRPV